MVNLEKPMHFTKEQSEWIKQYVIIKKQEAKAEVIEEIKKRVHPCDTCNICKTPKEFEYNYNACVNDEDVKLTKIFEILEQLKENI